MKRLSFCCFLPALLFLVIQSSLVLAAVSDQQMPASSTLYHQAAIEAIKNHDMKTAVSLLASSISQNPRDALAYHLLVTALKAQKAYRDIVKLIPEAEVFGVRSLQLYQDQAEAAFLIGSDDDVMFALAEMEKMVQ